MSVSAAATVQIFDLANRAPARILQEAKADWLESTAHGSP